MPLRDADPTRTDRSHRPVTFLITATTQRRRPIVRYYLASAAGIAAHLVLLATAAFGFTLPSAFSGSDGDFHPMANTTVDLTAARTGPWETTAPLTPGTGVYDAEQWVVVFRYSSVTIDPNVTVTFKNHLPNAPVIWLVTGDITINGTIRLNGAIGAGAGSGPALTSEPGPGGFAGGRGSRCTVAGSAGKGPGGGSYPPTGGRYATAYGNAGVFPLIGGSGGGGSDACNGPGGGAGGGAFLVATAGTLTLNGTIEANGGQGSGLPCTICGNHGAGGSGGGIRIIAGTVQGTGALRAIGAENGGPGRIRVEAEVDTLQDRGVPEFSFGVPIALPRIFRIDDDGVPTIRVVTLGGQPVPTDPNALEAFPSQDVTLSAAGTATLVMEGENLPQNSTVVARIVRQTGNAELVSAVFTGPGNGPSKTSWSAEVPVAGGFSTIQARAQLP